MKLTTAALAVLIVAALCCGSFLVGRATAGPSNSAAAPSMTGHLSAAAVTVPWEMRRAVSEPAHPRLLRHPVHVCGRSETSPDRSATPPRSRAVSLVTRCARRLLDTTAYCATGNRTASGVWPRIGMAASNLFPFGTRLRVPGIGVVEVTDRIGYGSQLDIYMGAEGCQSRAVQFGRRSLLVTVLGGTS